MSCFARGSRGLSEPHGLAFKAYEIEELADVYFFRPLGMVLARGALALQLTPTEVTIVAAVTGMTGGALLYDQRVAIVGFALLIAHAVLDSSDGQLARMTGQTSELGRVLDGVSGYLTHAAIYGAIVASAFRRGIDAWTIGLALAAAAANVAHSQMYDYHRSAYIACVIDGMTRGERLHRRAMLSAYETMQAWFAGSHRDVEAAIATRAPAGMVDEQDRARYRDTFYRVVRGWNLLGDNTRFYAVGVLAWVHRIDVFPLVVLVPMNAAFIALSLWQRRADRRFLAGP